MHRTSRAWSSTWTAVWDRFKRWLRRNKENEAGEGSCFSGGVSFGAAGRIWRRCRVHVKEPLVRGVAGRVTVAVGRIFCWATRGEFFAARRLRELPDGGVADAASSKRWQVLRER